ncbi:hypothetical protein E2C01_006075 [Portunus trituberculatus]|uniref:Uncharacterized protein n=1 Tax=Portunus trituberculatus TaxID=210409 RepID=A0A5B7D0T6_PORTR|nr:hypothetical protein [Portunus trituberculatus]
MHLPHTHLSLKTQNLKMATPHPSSESPSEEETRNLPR